MAFKFTIVLRVIPFQETTLHAMVPAEIVAPVEMAAWTTADTGSPARFKVKELPFLLRQRG